MNKMSKLAILSVISVLILSGSGLCQVKEKNKYKSIEVTRFEIKEGVEFPPDYLVTMTDELLKHLAEMKKFNQVFREGESPSEGSTPSLRLVGTVTKFQAGSRAKRMIIGFGAGKTTIVAHVKFVDRETNAVLFEKDVDGKVILGGAIKSESIGATSGLAKEVASVTKKAFFQ